MKEFEIRHCSDPSYSSVIQVIMFLVNMSKFKLLAREISYAAH